MREAPETFKLGFYHEFPFDVGFVEGTDDRYPIEHRIRLDQFENNVSYVDAFELTDGKVVDLEGAATPDAELIMRFPDEGSRDTFVGIVAMRYKHGGFYPMPG